ncbi:MAG: GTP-sensing pleiotropic transcriptional regulator CodY [Synergistaceae bacterium]|nr:GTP-sensing pleiotropic transcriptional regulator CodY [Synergistaceae bacterium]
MVNRIKEHDPVLVEILENVRQFGRIVQSRGEGHPLDYSKLAKLLCDFTNSNVYIFGPDAKKLGYSWVLGYSSKRLEEFFSKSGVMPEEFTEKLQSIKETEICDEDACLFDDDDSKVICDKHLLYVPIHGAGLERLGTIMLVRVAENFVIKDILLAEYLATLVGIEILHDRSREIEERSRHRVSVQMAMRALSYSESEAMKHIIARIKGDDGVVIASKIADRAKVTRSVIVSALRKLESAGLIKSRSLGMKGTYIRVLSPLIVEELGLPENFEEEDEV